MPLFEKALDGGCFLAVNLLLLVLSSTLSAASGSSCTASGPTVTLSPGSDIQGAINRAAPGTTLVFTPGTYYVNELRLASGVSFQGQSGVTFQYAGNGAIMLYANGVSDINICGIHFDGSPWGGAVDFLGAITLDYGTSNIHITGNTFSNFVNESDLKFFAANHLYFQGNISGPNEYEPVSGYTLDHGDGISSVYITDNEFFGFDRMGVEIGVWSYVDVHIDGNTFRNFGPAMCISLGDGAQPFSAKNTVWGNTMNGTSGYGQWGIELDIKNASVEHNTMTNIDAPIQISAVPGSEIENNSFTNFHIPSSSSPFGYDGGYDGTEWIGSNLWNGTAVTGWPGNKAYGPQPPVNQPSTPFLGM